ncbi:MAG: hypothetical protein WCW66_03950 [Patescibacteria group bacterium]
MKKPLVVSAILGLIVIIVLVVIYNYGGNNVINKPGDEAIKDFTDSCTSIRGCVFAFGPSTEEGRVYYGYGCELRAEDEGKTCTDGDECISNYCAAESLDDTEGFCGGSYMKGLDCKFEPKQFENGKANQLWVDPGAMSLSVEQQKIAKCEKTIDPYRGNDAIRCWLP